MSDTTQPVTVYWRRWCPYCVRLEFGLRRAGIRYRRVNITDPDAAALVRAITGGDEITPTVIANGVELVNPSVADVRAALAG